MTVRHEHPWTVSWLLLQVWGLAKFIGDKSALLFPLEGWSGDGQASGDSNEGKGLEAHVDQH